jgi:hypothetical protein
VAELVVDPALRQVEYDPLGPVDEVEDLARGLRCGPRRPGRDSLAGGKRLYAWLNFLGVLSLALVLAAGIVVSITLAGLSLWVAAVVALAVLLGVFAEGAYDLFGNKPRSRSRASAKPS